MDAIIDLIPPKIAAHLPLSNAGYVYAPLEAGFFGLVDVARPSLWLAIGNILFNPIYWNIVARNGE
jgi:methylene-fatty-acyl-phospholipid synthase